LRDLTSSDHTIKLDTDAGPIRLVDVGWGWGNGLRAAIEGSFRAKGIATIPTQRENSSLMPLANEGGMTRTYALMANITHDLPFHFSTTPLQPHVGADVGYGWLDFGSASGSGYGPFALPQGNRYTRPTSVRFGSDGAFAYQAIVGDAMPLRLPPAISTTVGYRFFGIGPIDSPADRTAADASSHISGGARSISTHDHFTERTDTVLINVRYAFGAQ
jgi:OmpA-OmpF porin, OOP family